jgi:TonB family protein
MILYILEVSIGWALFYLLYHLVLRQTTFFALNRWYLLLTFVVALILPALPPLWSIHQPAEPTVSEMVNLELLLANLDYWQEFQLVEAEPEADTTNWWLVAYWMGVLVMLSRFIYGMFQIGRYFFTGKKERKGIHRLVFTQKEHLPFSFFRWIFWGRQPLIEAPEADRILRHEQAHIRQGHSIDVVLVEVVSTIAWFSPLVFFYRKALRSNHEFLADAAVTKAYKIKEYGHLLIQQSLSGPQIALVNHLIHSQLKNRIIMMTKKRSTRLSLLRYLLALPVIALLLLAFTYDEAYGLDELPVFSDEFPEIPLPSFGKESANDIVSATILPVEEKKVTSAITATENAADLPFLTSELFKGSLQPVTPANQADTTKPEPLIVLNGQIMEEAKMDAFPADQIKSVNVLKGEMAIEKYGQKGRNGVVEINCPACDGKDAEKTEPAKEEKKKLADQISNQEPHPLLVLNGEKISRTQANQIDPANIKAINVLKDASAVEKYGDAGKNGVVEIDCPKCQIEEVDKNKTSIRIRGGKGAPLYVINGVVQEKTDGDPVKDIKPDQIKSINVLKGDSAIEKYGEKGANGVIEIDCPSCEGEKAVKEEPTSKVRFRVNDGISADPLYILNGERIDHLDLGEINPNNIKAITVLKDASAVALYGEAAKNGVIIIDCPKCNVKKLKKKSEMDGYETKLRIRSQKDSDIQGETFNVVEEMPVFQGCDGEGMSREEQAECSRKKLVEFVYNNIQYPSDKKLKDVEGMVVAEFVVDKSGKVGDVKIRRSLQFEFDTEVVKVLEQLPKFEPGRQRGKKVDVKMTIPVKFWPLKGSPADRSRQEFLRQQKQVEKELTNGKTLQLQSFNATPNPTKGRLHLRFEAAPQNTLVRVLDASGQEVLRKQLRNFNGLYDEYLDLSNAPKGMLLIHISQEDRQFLHKIVTQ